MSLIQASAHPGVNPRTPTPLGRSLGARTRRRGPHRVRRHREVDAGVQRADLGLRRTTVRRQDAPGAGQRHHRRPDVEDSRAGLQETPGCHVLVRDSLAQPIHSTGFRGTIDDVTYRQRPGGLFSWATRTTSSYSPTITAAYSDLTRQKPAPGSSGVARSARESTSVSYRGLTLNTMSRLNMARTALAMGLIFSGQADVRRHGPVGQFGLTLPPQPPATTTAMPWSSYRRSRLHRIRELLQKLTCSVFVRVVKTTSSGETDSTTTPAVLSQRIGNRCRSVAKT